MQLEKTMQIIGTPSADIDFVKEAEVQRNQKQLH
jgi:hypothetical protein